MKAHAPIQARHDRRTERRSRQPLPISLSCLPPLRLTDSRSIRFTVRCCGY